MRRRPLLLLATLLPLAAGAGAPLRAQADPPPAHIVPVVIKLDDLRTNASGWLSTRWRRVGDLVRDRRIKVSLGIIADSLEGDKPAYFKWLREMHDTGLVELWFHGYDHKEWEENGRKLEEFHGTPYALQKEHFVKSQALARAKLGFPFTAFGAPFNATDAVTDRVLAEDPDIKVVLYGTPADRASGKVILDRVYKVNIEQPLFLPNYEKFVAGYNHYAATRRYFVIQGHANKWDDARWAEFLKIVDYITRNHIPTVTPTALAATLQTSSPEKP